jgi:predicted RNA-binding Zn ribbon-like protein
VAVARPNFADDLRELIAALDRRAPHIERAGEASIAKDAAALRARALKLLKDLAAEKHRVNREASKRP